MNKSELYKLIQKHIDSSLSREESARLKSLIDTDPDARNFYEEQVNTAGLLEELASLDPPDRLKKRIMNAIDTDLYASQSTQRSARSSRSARPFRIHPRLALAFAFGLALGVIVPLMMRMDRNFRTIDSSEFIGTIGLHESERFTEIERLPVRKGQIHGELVFRTFGDIVGCEIQLESGKECEMLLTYTAEQYSFYGFRPSDMTEIELEHVGDSIRTLNRSQVRYVIFLRRLTPEPGQMHITLRQSGQTIYRKDIDLGSGGS